ncbi:hypothetical protein CHS0354_026577 [Potamilus streckersoni]|uniref:C-type lectin domain-containing protein n=1 Tax=Potamilus streckersoni TaxID=2493646 RepID=A0AAE0TIU9_9BIVA|nr:hypothetical protein CHS0354_026577 [Potamilus streckersoni]
MRMILTLAFLILFHQFLMGITYVSSATVDCNENSVLVKDHGSSYQSVNLLVGRSCCRRTIQRDAENSMKNICMNSTEVDARNKTLNTKIDKLEKKIDSLIQLILTVINRCPSGYDYIDNSCYKFHNECKTWFEARQICQNESGDLIKLKAKHLDFFRNLLRSKRGACSMVWVGATKAGVDGNWRWLIGGEVVVSGIWYQGNPKTSGNENCGSLANITDYKMSNKDCTLEGNFICQIV